MPGWIAGGIVLGSMISSNSARSAANKQMAFQEDLSGTAYQRSVKDMRAAGLNPILAAHKGGATTPPGAMPSEFFGSKFGEASARGVEAKRMKQEVNLMRQTERLSRQQELTERSRTEQEAYKAGIGRIDAEIYQRAAHGKGYMESAANRLVEEARAASSASRLEADIDSGKVGEWSRVLRRLLPSVNSAAGAARSVR